MISFGYNLLKSVRPRQWLKNFSVGAALVFAGGLFESDKVWLTIEAIVIFIFVASAIYLFNDVMDRESDRKHPFKRLRPIAAGKIKPWQALSIAALLLLVTNIWAYNLSTFFFGAVLFYWLMQIAYSVYLKNIAIIDMIIVAGGFILRIYAGAMVIDAHLSIWFLLCVVSVALLISVGKRRAELTILTKEKAAQHRHVLSKYSRHVLDSYVAMFANSAFLSWSLFTFFQPPLAVSHALPYLFTRLPLTLSGTNKWLMITIPFVIYGLMRYVKIIYEGSKAESPERVLLSDKPLLSSVIVWGITVVFILYYLPGD